MLAARPEGLEPLSVFPAGAATTQNKVSMVTFFPVPYVAYSNVSVAKEMDIGLTDQTCSLTLGSTGLNTAPLEVANTNVTNGALFLGGNQFKYARITRFYVKPFRQNISPL